MSKLERELTKTIIAIKRAKEGSYEQHRRSQHFIRIWNRYVKQHQVPYNPTLISELRESHYLEVGLMIHSDGKDVR